jgi:glycosyltransferase involved in cell wall biosynthesis
MSARRPLRVLHVITGFNAGGGAETLLLRLLEELTEEERRGHQVISLRPQGSLAPAVEALGIPVSGLGMIETPAAADAKRVRELARAIRRSGADVVQTWMLHSNILTGLAGKAATHIPIVWGVHVSEVTRETQGTATFLFQRAEAVCSWFLPARIIACSASAQEAMERLHYKKRLLITIPNGFDVERFKPDAEAGAAARKELGLGPDQTVIGHVARFHPVKGHAALLEAAPAALAADPTARLVLCGDGVTRDNPAMAKLLEPLGEQAIPLGPRDDLPRLLNAFDFAVSSSAGEALPLAVGEAMASGLPMVATDTGDSKLMVGDTGLIVPVGDETALAAAIAEMMAGGREKRAELGRRARERISSRYAMAVMVDGYRRVWDEAVVARG